ncbi:MAG TPA: hypothetical protein VF125_11375 [Solirubrobacterales bacterium]
MSSKRVLALLAIAACVAAPVAPALAEGEAETRAFGAFRLKGSNGYSIFAIAISKPNFKHGELVIFVGGKGGSAIYLAPAKVEPTAIEADLGAVGRVDVHFEPSGPPERIHARREENGSAVFEPGFWVGTIDRGRGRLHRATVARTKATVDPFFERAGCGMTMIGEQGGHGIEGARLVARSAWSRESRFLQANKNHDKARVYLEADVEERHGGLIVDRLPVGGIRLRSFLADGDPCSAAAVCRPRDLPSKHQTGEPLDRRPDGRLPRPRRRAARGQELQSDSRSLETNQIDQAPHPPRPL